MNNVVLCGRLTKDVDVRVNANTQKAIARFTLAINRSKDDTDFINCVAFGKTAELTEKYLSKGKQVMVVGSIKTGSYEKDGHKVYTTDVWVDRVEFVSKADDKGEKPAIDGNPFDGEQVEGFSKISNEDIPF